jgi:thymidylate kinase
MQNKPLRIVLTGGPGGGKTTALDLFRRELNEKVAVVPEAASILFKGGMPRSNDTEIIKCTQKAIYNLQKSLEEIQAAMSPHKLLICDRGTLDGVAYWPGGEEEFFNQMNSSFEKEMGRYDAVIFFETAASNGNDINSNNPVRTESKQQARDLDKRLQEIWSKHPNYHFVASSESFVRKIMFGIMTIENVIRKHKI